jgi:hypothetical protein
MALPILIHNWVENKKTASVGGSSLAVCMAKTKNPYRMGGLVVFLAFLLFSAVMVAVCLYGRYNDRRKRARLQSSKLHKND